MNISCKKSVLLLGATGLTGGKCLQQLVNNSNFDQVITLTRRPLVNIDHPKIKSIIFNFNNMTCEDMINAEHLICTLGTTMKKAGTKDNFFTIDHDYALKIARIGRKNGIKYMHIVSALGANPRSLFFYNRTKGQLEQALQELGFSGLTILRPGLLLGKRREFRAGEEVFKSVCHKLALLTPAKYKPIQAETVATALVRAVQKADSGLRIMETKAIKRFAAGA